MRRVELFPFCFSSKSAIVQKGKSFVILERRVGTIWLEELRWPRATGVPGLIHHNHSGLCPHVPNRAGFLLPSAGLQTVGSECIVKCKVALQEALVPSREKALRG